MARLNRGRLVPHHLDPTNEKVSQAASEVVRCYEDHIGKPRAALETELTRLEAESGPRLDARRGFRIVRAFGKLLEERSEWAAPAEIDPYNLRTRIYDLASQLPEPPAGEAGLLDSPTREDVLSQVAREMGLRDAETVAALMFSDRQSAQVLSEFGKPGPEELVSRYNVAQVQGVLYAAKELTVELDAEADARLVFHYVKRMGLIHSIEPPRNGFSGYRLRLDGPLSLFGPTRKYGLRLAKFLPGLMLTAPWKLSATVEWRGRDALLELDSSRFGIDGTKSHYTGPKRDEEQDEVREAFVKAWERAKDTAGWKLAAATKVLNFPEHGAALVPDFTLTNQKTGETVYLEILGFWSKRNLVERVGLIRSANERGERVIVAASEGAGASKEALSEATSGGVVSFKGRLPAKAVLERISPGIGTASKV